MTRNAALAILNFAVAVDAYEISYPVEKMPINLILSDAQRLVEAAREAQEKGIATEVANTVIAMDDTMAAAMVKQAMPEGVSS